MIDSALLDALFKRAVTDPADKILFNYLGFKHFDINDQNVHYIGEVKLEGYSNALIKVSVTCMPATFWTFNVRTEENKDYEINTGSGPLIKYWLSIRYIAQDMIVPLEVKRK